MKDLQAFLRLANDCEAQKAHWQRIKEKERRFGTLLAKMTRKLEAEEATYPKLKRTWKRLEREIAGRRLEVAKKELRLTEFRQQKELLEYELIKVSKKRQALEEAYVTSLSTQGQENDIGASQQR